MLIPQTYAVKNVNDFVSFSGIGIQLGNLSGHRTLITFCKLIANYMYIAHTFS